MFLDSKPVLSRLVFAKDYKLLNLSQKIRRLHPHGILAVRINRVGFVSLYCKVVSEVQRYKVIIEVDGSIDHKGRKVRVSGVTGREAYGESEDDAKDKAVRDFRENSDYNTDISVNKRKFPDGRYLDDWGYDSSTAQAIDAVLVEEFGPISVKWDQRGRHYCEWESRY